MKKYLGDSVYVDVDRGALVLTTENGFGPSNTIILESEIYDALIAYVEHIRQQANQQPTTEESNNG